MYQRRPAVDTVGWRSEIADTGRRLDAVDTGSERINAFPTKKKKKHTHIRSNYDEKTFFAHLYHAYLALP